jgi:hypothetical protein
MTTTFRHVIGGQIDSKFTVDGNTVVIGELPEKYEFLTLPYTNERLEDRLRRYCRSTGNAMDTYDRNCGLFIQIQTEYPDDRGGRDLLPMPDEGTRKAGYTTVKTYTPRIGNSNHSDELSS